MGLVGGIGGFGWWDWRFLVLIAFTSGWSYVVGIVELRGYDESRKGEWEQTAGSKTLLTISLLVNLGILGYFKQNIGKISCY